MSAEVLLIDWIQQHSSLSIEEATEFVRREIEENGDDCWSWQAVMIGDDGQPQTCHVYDADDWRERGFKVYVV